ncbi:MAG: T9SS type A sorting domain-containing protein [Bacteroidota bacterium]
MFPRSFFPVLLVPPVLLVSMVPLLVALSASMLWAPAAAGQWLVDEQVVHPRTRSGVGERYAWNVAVANDSTVLVSTLRERDQANEGTLNDGSAVGLGGVLVYRKATDGSWRTRDLLLPIDFPDPIRSAPEFGTFVDTFGESVIVSAPTEGGIQFGAVYIFERNPATDSWDRCARLPNPLSPDTAPDLPNSQRASDFGDRVAINDRFAVVSSRGFDRLGAVFIYERAENPTCSESDWTLIQTISEDLFVQRTVDNRGSLQLFGDRLFIGRPYSEAAGMDNGAVHVLVWDQNNRQFQPDFGSPLLPQTGTRETYFGEDLDYDGEYLAIGAEGFVENGVNVGATFIFRRGDTRWTSTPDTILFSDDPQERHEFGKQVEFSGPLLIIGENGRDAGPSEEQEETGIIHVFEPTESGWRRADRSLFAPEGLVRGANFGEEVSAIPGLVIVGAPENLLDREVREGSAYAYTVIQAPPPAPVLVAPSSESVGVRADAVLQFQWAPAPTAESYQVEIALDEAFEDVVASADGIEGTTYDLAAGSLAAGTPYFWRVASANVAGVSPPSADRFVTNVATPVLAMPEAGETGVALAPILSWSTVVGADRYEVTVATDAALTAPVVEATLVEGGTFTVTDGLLVGGTTYFWQVRARHASDPAVFSDPSGVGAFQTRFDAPALVTADTPFVDDEAVTLRWQAFPTATAYRVQWGTDPSFAEVETSEVVTETTLSFSPPAVARARYVWRVAVEEPGADDEDLAWTASTFVVYARTVSVALDVSFGDPELAASYRLLALPGAETIPLSALFSGPYMETWRAFNDDGRADDGANSFLVEYEPTDPFTFTPGKSYWVLGTTPATYTDTDARAVALVPGTYTYEVPVRTGWNLIGSPYSFAVPWDRVQAATPWPVGDALYAYSGDFELTDTLRPREGYYLFVAEEEPGPLVLPYLDVDPEPGLAAPPAMVRLRLTQGAVERTLELAADPDARIGLDARDRVAAPRVFAPLSAGFAAGDGRAANRVWLQRETRARIAAGTRVRLEAQTSTDEVTSVLLDTAALPEGLVVALVPTTGAPVVLEPGVAVPLAMRRDDVYRAELVIDRPEAVAALAGVPTALALYTPHPNPAAGQTSVQLDLPETSEARVAVYDVRGRLALLLHEGTLEAGVHHLPADVAALASGAYLVRVEALGQAQTRLFTVVVR